MNVAIPALGTFLTVSVVVCAAFVCLKRSKNAFYFSSTYPHRVLSPNVFRARRRTGQRTAKPERRTRPPENHGEPEVLRDHTQSGPVGKNPRWASDAISKSNRTDGWWCDVSVFRDIGRHIAIRYVSHWRGSTRFHAHAPQSHAPATVHPRELRVFLASTESTFKTVPLFIPSL